MKTKTGWILALALVLVTTSIGVAPAFGQETYDFEVAIYFNPIRGEHVPAYGYEGTKMALEDNGYEENVNYVNALDPESLKDYQVLIITGVLGYPKAWDLNEVRENQRKFVERGGGIILMQESVGWRCKETFKDNPPFPEIGRGIPLPGGKYAPVSVTPLQVVDKSHPITKGLPAEFEQQYDTAPLGLGEKGKVVIKLADDAIVRSQKVKLDNVAAVIVGEHGKGRVVLMGPMLGLNRLPREMENPPKGGCLKLLLNAVKWAAGVE